MKKSFKRIIATVMAISTAAVSGLSVTANAANEASDAELTKTAEQAVMENMAVIAKSSEPFYYPEYDSYDTMQLAPTEHYLVGLPVGNVSLPRSLGVYFYLNTNILSDSSSPISASHFSICPGYEGYASFGTISSSTPSTAVKRIFARFNVNGKSEEYSPLFTYHLEGVENLTEILDSEADLDGFTSESTLAPSSVLTTNKSSVILRKSVYALGDVDRDGDVDNDDVAAVQKYVANLCEGAVGRTEDEKAYDEAVFLLAADFNRDGIVDISDAVGILQYYQKNNK